MKIKLDTDKLALPGPGAAAGWVAELPARATEQREAIDELAALGLTSAEIDRLGETLKHQRTAATIAADWPSLVQDHAVLEAAAALAEALSTVLQGASPRARAELDTAALLALREPTYPRSAAADLSAFASALRKRTEERPTQGRRRPATHIVRALAAIAGDRLGAVTHADGSTFRLAALAAFKLAGQHTSPDRAIQEYRESLDDRS